VGPDVPKGVVLLVDVIPAFVTKLCAPYFIHTIPYHVRVIIFASVSACGMLLIALSPAHTDGSTIGTKMLGVILASLSSGGGELSFLGLTHFYGPVSLAAWGSGTGGAGLLGAGVYALATTTLGYSVKSTLLLSAFLPAVMLVSFFIVLPREPLRYGTPMKKDASTAESAVTGPEAEEEDEEEEDDIYRPIREDEGLLGTAPPSSPKMVRPRHIKTESDSAWDLFRANLKRSSSLFFPLSVLRFFVRARRLLTSL
jgi:battenin